MTEHMNDRRKYPRIDKTFMLSYFECSNPNQKREITQLKNISKGGMCFVTTHYIEPSTAINIELKTPYLSALTYLEGNTVESIEKVENMVYETRLQFNNLSEQSEELLEKIIEFFIKEQEEDNA